MADQNALPKAPPDQTIGTWREAMGYSQREAAKELGISRGSIANWEHHPELTPRTVKLAMAALALGIKVDGPGAGADDTED